jgi:N-succinyldiaminopimelate aminotransferase
MSQKRQPFLSARLQGFGTSIFAEMTALAAAHDAVNLGQGYPDFDGPDFVKDAAVAALRAGHNQYCRSSGILPAVRAVAAHERRFYGLDYDAESEVTVYAGATEAIAATLQALTDVGDEVALFEPAYDSYLAVLAMAGAVPRVVPLRPPTWGYDPAALEAALGPKTRAILLNTPHNPTGKVFTRAELEHIASLARERDLLVITDEVYEHITFGCEHVPLATLPGMRERTVVISSMGKSFSLTGWKLGWTCAPAVISAALRSAHQFLTFCNATPFQHALAAGLEQGDAYFRELRADYERRRDRLGAGLRAAGFDVLTPAGTYFILADIRPLGYDDDVAFCRALPARAGVAAIPVSVFCPGPAAPRHLVRFAFCKTDATLDAAVSRLMALRAAPVSAGA